MLTIKHVEEDFHESINEIEHGVHYYPRNSENRARVEAFGMAGWATGHAIFSNGKIFVMNDKGRTIQQYNLDEDNHDFQEIEPGALGVL